jgi:ribosomal protein S18 acetylase RimI-like enzyme
MKTILRPQVLPLEEKWLHLVAQMTRSWLHPDIWPLTLFSCPGYTDSLRENLKVPERQRSQFFYGAFMNGRLAGFAEWRMQTDSLLLNNLFVSPGNRGNGIGRMLVETGWKRALEDGLSSLDLDVFTYESKTVRWYREMGFLELHRRYWHTGTNPFTREDSEDGGAGDYSRKGTFILQGFPQAEAVHRAFGFSSFEARTKAGIHQIGRLHQRYYRLCVENPELDTDLLSGLALLEPTRRLLVISPYSHMPDTVPLDPVCAGIRLRLKLISS